MTITHPQFAIAYTVPGQNANNALMLNVLKMPVGVLCYRPKTDQLVNNQTIATL